jgi:hypothetical protein
MNVSISPEGSPAPTPTVAREPSSNSLKLDTMAASAASSAGGTAWVRRFLQPLLDQKFSRGRRLACLQLAGDDATEAEELRRLGHTCVMGDPDAGGILPFPGGSYDFLFTGHFTQRALDTRARAMLAGECFRVLRVGGAFLVLMGNRWCPIDLSRNGPLLHGPWSLTCLGYHECERLFVQRAGFAVMEPLGLAGHFAWGRLPRCLRPLGRMLDLHWQFLATPARKWLYSSPGNPTFLLWLTKR